jgi:hypothetical protein
MRGLNILALTFSGLLALASGCRDTSINPSVDNVMLNVKASRSSLEKTDATLGISSVKVLLKRIRFGAAVSDDSVDVQSGIVAVPLDLNGGMTMVGVSRVRAGVYDRVKFQLHKPEDTEPIPDPEFREGESGNLRFSVIVRGTYGGVPFVYRSRVNAEQEQRLRTPVTIGEGGMTSVTLLVDPVEWFLSGGLALDPALLSNSSAIDESIRTSFGEVFRDDNRDGRPD